MTENLPTMLPNAQEFQMFQTIAKSAQASGLYQGDSNKIFMVMLAARELGISPMLALNGGIWNIQGKIEISARLMNSMIRRGGNTLEIKSTATECTITGKRADTGQEHSETFTWAMAEKAGLIKSNVWQKYPEDMLYNRCMSRIARRLFPDVIGTAYVEGEIREALNEKDLPQAECEEITQSVEPKCDKITQEQLDTFLELAKQADDICIGNMCKYLESKWNVTHYAEMTPEAFDICMKGLTNNIEMNARKAVSA